jgi:TolB-like protein
MRRFVTPLLILLLLIGCAEQLPEYVKGGKQYGVTEGLFRNRWWNYYERGLSFSEGEFNQRAIEDFKSAISQRGEDQWRARTYGMHFVNYFPHREQGIVFLRQNRIKDAIHELELSLTTADSDKAKYFLNKARKLLLETTGADKTPPLLSLKNPTDHLTTNKFTVTLSGVAEDDNFVALVKVNGRPLPLELSTERFEFKTDVSLSEGNNQIVVSAEDLTGKTAEMIVNIHADRQGPVITIADTKRLGDKIIIEGYGSDHTGIASLTFNGKEIEASLLEEVAFKQELAPGPVTIEAVDTVGNKTVAEIANVEMANAIGPRPLLAGLMMNGSNAWPRTQTVSDIMPNTRQGRLFALGLGTFMDNNPPNIKLAQLTDNQSVYDKEILIEGKVEDESGIQSLTLNKEQILRKRGKQIFFSQLEELHRGNNEFDIVALDTSGNSAARAITVNRKIEEIRQIGYRMSVALLPLDKKGSTTILGEAVYDGFLSALHNQGRFKVVERKKLEDLLRELKLSKTEIIDPRTAAKMGQIIAADCMITGTIFETENSIEIIARLIDTESSVVLSANDVFDEGKSLGAMNNLVQRLAYKFKRDFPLLEGIIIDLQGKQGLIDLGRDKNIKEHVKLIVFRDGPEVRHPVTGRLLGSEPMELGEAKVTDVLKEYSKVLITKRTAVPKALDKVITK